ncbi:Zinc finger protein 91 [Papilio xuthus]|uniref:Zinc finger protein 91 n=1 Tax=Papilio xuthus TaxID=66420 RepID=A0A0N0P9Y2_PAPXU|nr:Zinc finger protein 91 [Papilio xuthus]
MRRRRRANNQLPEESDRRIAKTMMRRNAMTILECSTAWAFRWFHSAFYCSYCDDKFVDTLPLREHVITSHLNDPPTPRVFAKLTENNMLKIDITSLNCTLCNCVCSSIDILKNHLSVAHKKTFNKNYSDGVLPFKLDQTGFNCQICFDYFSSFSKINEHMNSHYQNYICDACGKAFVSKSRFRTHVQSHEIGNFPCGDCDEVLQTRAARMCHRLKVHKSGVRYACPRCPEVFTTYYARAKHLVDSHAQQKRDYECRTCGDEENSASQSTSTDNVKWSRKRKLAEENVNAAIILEHSNTVVFRWNRGKFMCAYCPCTYTNVKEIRLHSEDHKNKLDVFYYNPEVRNKFPLRVDITDLCCIICNEKTENLEVLKKHLSDMHNKTFNSNNISLVPFVLTNEKYSCVACGKYFETLMALFSHMNEHYSDYVCYTCGKGYSSKHKLQSHQKYHESGEFQCPKCDTVLSSRVARDQHVSKVHGSKERYRCPICNEQFSSYYGRSDSTDIQATKRIVPLFQVDYDRSLCRPLGTVTNFKKVLAMAQLSGENLSSRSPSPIYMDRAPSPQIEHDRIDILQLQEQIPQKNVDIRQNALTLFEFSTVYPFVYGNNKFKCFICSQPFLETSLLRRHMQDTHTYAPIKRLVNNRRENVIKVDVSEMSCRLCPFKPKDLQEIKLHLKVEHHKLIEPELKDNIIPFVLEGDEEGYKCVMCESKFIKVRTLVIHMSVHFNNYSCEICGSGFMTLRLLKKHLEVHESGNFHCDRCSKVFNTSYKLSLHIRGVHLKQYPRRCPMCPERFNSNYRRTKHLQDVHNQSTRVHKCKTCGRGFNLRYHLVCHTRSVHLQERNHQCKICLQRFCNKETLKRHMVIHTGEKNYKCEMCGEAFLRRKNLRDHLRVHEVL